LKIKQMNNQTSDISTFFLFLFEFALKKCSKKGQ